MFRDAYYIPYGEPRWNWRRHAYSNTLTKLLCSAAFLAHRYWNSHHQHKQPHVLPKMKVCGINIMCVHCSTLKVGLCRVPSACNIECNVLQSVVPALPHRNEQARTSETPLDIFSFASLASVIIRCSTISNLLKARLKLT